MTVTPEPLPHQGSVTASRPYDTAANQPVAVEFTATLNANGWFTLVMAMVLVCLMGVLFARSGKASGRLQGIIRCVRSPLQRRRLSRGPARRQGDAGPSNSRPADRARRRRETQQARGRRR